MNKIEAQQRLDELEKQYDIQFGDVPPIWTHYDLTDEQHDEIIDLLEMVAQ